MASRPYNQDVYDAHPADCASLPHFKFFRPGGVCCISCYENCTDCGAPFYHEAMRFIEDGGPIDPDDGLVEDAWLCDCCNRKRAAVPAEAATPTTPTRED